MNIISVQSRGDKFVIVVLVDGRYYIALKRIGGKMCNLVSMKEGEKSRKAALKVAEDWLGGEEC